MDELDINGIRVFREIVEAGSFTAAADRLGMAAPMVSKHIARLERKLGARLLNRSSRSMSLTEAGKNFFEQGRQALDILDTAVASLAQAGGPPRGELKISAPVWCANAGFADLLAEFHSSYPEIRIDLHLDNHMADLVADGFDLALRVTDDPTPSLIARRVCSLKFHLVATPAFLDRQKLAGERRTIAMIMPNYVQLERLNLPSLANDPALKFNTIMKSSDTTLSYHCVLASMGAAFLPGWLVDHDLATGRLKTVGADGSGFDGNLYAVYASRRQMPAKLRCFIDFLLEKLGDQVSVP
ncbi:LysR family transcriptional regulator [Undibacterium sp. TS12]|uniref:LysR family transcriptional regulator n=1 Tax=Undibacterium sp. TS12 TaxID=2908202 RepID=UPI001F4C84AF|nr:LysR family transcriptional regulator [Undibacterium sp. TS12]MCH8620984.1 LysR family transcriptional regulator [Undibacterium sp. TS12]